MSICVVCRRTCSRYRITCRACYDNGHRPLEGKSDSEVAALVAINDSDTSAAKAASKRANPPSLDDDWECVHVEQDRNRAFGLKRKLEQSGRVATQRRENGVYRIYARKLQEAA